MVACPSRNRSRASQPIAPAAPRAGGGDEDDRRRVVGTERGAGVEAVPAEPEQPGAEHHQGQVVRPHRVLAEADPGADDQGERERRGARADLDGHAAGEVDRADAVGQPATGVPRAVEVEDPVRDRRVDQQRPDRDEHHPRPEPRAVGDRAGDQRAGDHAEQSLEDREQDHRHRQPGVGALGEAGPGARRAGAGRRQAGPTSSPKARE